jgi:hypothetical protein
MVVRRQIASASNFEFEKRLSSTSLQPGSTPYVGKMLSGNTGKPHPPESKFVQRYLKD